MGDWAQDVELRLPALSRVGKLRVDVADRPGFLHLHGMSIVSGRGETIWEWDGHPSSLPVRHDLIYFSGPLGSTWLSTTYDPYIELPLAPAVLDRLSDARVVLKVGWPASADHAIAIGALGDQERRWAAENQNIARRMAEFEEQLGKAGDERRVLHARLAE